MDCAGEREGQGVRIGGGDVQVGLDGVQAAVEPLRRALRVALPQLLPAFLNGCELALGLCWKAGVAAEVIGMPKGSIGERLQQAKVYLDTPDLFAWTLVIVLVSWAFGRCALWAFGALGRRLAGMPRHTGR